MNELTRLFLTPIGSLVFLNSVGISLLFFTSGCDLLPEIEEKQEQQQERIKEEQKQSQPKLERFQRVETVDVYYRGESAYSTYIFKDTETDVSYAISGDNNDSLIWQKLDGGLDLKKAELDLKKAEIEEEERQEQKKEDDERKLYERLKAKFEPCC